MNSPASASTVTIPLELFEKLMEHSDSLLEAREELEDFFIAHNPDLIKKLEEARQAHLAGQFVPYDQMKARYV